MMLNQMRRVEKSTFKLVTSQASICSAYYDQQSKRIQFLLCPDGFLKFEGELILDDREKLEKYERYLESEKTKLKRESKHKLAEVVTRILAAIYHLKRRLKASDKSEARSIELDRLDGEEFEIDFLDGGMQSIKKMGPFAHKDGFAQLPLCVENWKKIENLNVRKIDNEEIVASLQFTVIATRTVMSFNKYLSLFYNIDFPTACLDIILSMIKYEWGTDFIKNPIRKCRAAGDVEPRKLGILQTSCNERFLPRQDRRTILQDFLAKESDACVCKLTLEYEYVDPDTDETKRRFYQATGSIMNMQLKNGTFTKPFIMTTAHTFLQTDALDKSRSWLVGATAYLRRKGEDGYAKKIPVDRYRVYDRYLELDAKDLSFHGADFAVASIDVDPTEIGVKTFDTRFFTLPTDIEDLRRLADKSSIDVNITGYSAKDGREKNRFLPLTMGGSITKILPRKGNHALLIYDNLDTSPGTDGAMIHMRGPDGVGRNLGIHVGNSDGRPYGLLLTQPIMSWLHDTITCGDFWPGDKSYISDIQQPIGSWMAYDPYRDSPNIKDCQDSFDKQPVDQTTSVVETDTSKDLKGETLNEVIEEEVEAAETEVAEPVKEDPEPVKAKEEIVEAKEAEAVKEADSEDAGGRGPLPALDAIVHELTPQSEELSKVFEEFGFNMLSSIYEVQKPTQEKDADGKVEYRLILPFEFVEDTLIDFFFQYTGTRTATIASLIMQYTGRRNIVLLHAAYNSGKPRLEIIPTKRVGYNQIGATMDNFSPVVLAEPKKTSIASIYYDQHTRQLSAWVGQAGYLEHQEIDTAQDVDDLEKFRACLEAEENHSDLAKSKRTLKAVKHVRNAHKARIRGVHTGIAMDMRRDDELLAFEFFDENKQCVEMTGTYAIEDGFVLQRDLADAQLSMKLHKFKIHHYTKTRWQRMFGRHGVKPSKHRVYGPYNVRNDTVDSVMSPMSPRPFVAKMLDKIDLLYLTLIPIESMFNINKDQTPMYKDFATERENIKLILSNESYFYVDMFKAVLTKDSLLQNRHIIHIAGDGKESCMSVENKRGVCWDIEMKGTPEQNAENMLKRLNIRKDSFERQTENTFLVVYFTCYSEPQARALLRLGIPHVICIQQDKEVKSVACERFALVFYRSLFCHGNISKAFLVAKESLGDDGDMFMHLQAPDTDDNIENLTSIQRMEERRKLKIQIDNPEYDVPMSNEVGIFTDGEDLHVSWQFTVDVVQDLQASGCAVIYGPVMFAQEQMAKIVAICVHRLGHYKDGVFACMLKGRIYSKSQLIEAIVDCIHESNVYTEEYVKFDKHGESLKKFLKERSTIVLIYAGQALYGSGEVDWLCDDEEVRKEIYSFVLELHTKTLSAYETSPGAICVCFTGNAYQEFKTYAREVNRFRKHAYMTDGFCADPGMAALLREHVDKADDFLLPFTTNIFRRLQQMKKNLNVKEFTNLLNNFLDDINADFTAMYYDDPKKATFFDNLRTAVEIREKLCNYELSRPKSPTPNSPSVDMKESHEHEEEVEAKEEETSYSEYDERTEVSLETILNWVIQYLAPFKPDVVEKEENRQIILQALQSKFPRAHKSGTLNWLLDNEEGIACILDHWVQSDIGRDRILIAVNEKKRQDPGISLTNRRMWEKIADDFGVEEDTVHYCFLKNQSTDVAEALKQIRDGSWTAPNVEPLRDSLVEFQAPPSI